MHNIKIQVVDDATDDDGKSNFMNNSTIDTRSSRSSSQYIPFIRQFKNFKF